MSANNSQSAVKLFHPFSSCPHCLVSPTGTLPPLMRIPWLLLIGSLPTIFTIAFKCLYCCCFFLMEENQARQEIKSSVWQSTIKNQKQEGSFEGAAPGCCRKKMRGIFLAVVCCRPFGWFFFVWADVSVLSYPLNCIWWVLLVLICWLLSYIYLNGSWRLSFS